MRKYQPANVKTIPPEAKRKFKGEIFEVYQWPQEMFDGSVATFEMLRRPDTVKILAILTEDEARTLVRTQVSESAGAKLIVTKQEQPRKDVFYDYPGGRVDADDADELAAAKRELLEETGLMMHNWKLVKVEQPFAKIDWIVYTFLAMGLEGQMEQNLDAGEKIEVEALGIDEVEKLAASDEARYMRFQELSGRIDLKQAAKMPELYKY